MRRTLAVLGLAGGMAIAGASHAASVFINEIHYDNIGVDVGEAVEIAGPAGTDLAGWSLVLYNGNNGAVYDTTALSGILPDLQAGMGTRWFGYPTNGLQNGSPDGLALVDGLGAVVQFLSYEGSFVAVGGAADGMLSTDIGVAESSTTPIGHTLQLGGTGNVYGDFFWQAEAANTLGAVNAGQIFAPIPEPHTWAMMLAGLGLLGFAARRR